MALLKYPALQLVHLLAAALLQLPVLQVTQVAAETAPTTLLLLPAAQLMQVLALLAPVALLHVPEGQNRITKAGQYAPEGHTAEEILRIRLL